MNKFPGNAVLTPLQALVRDGHDLSLDWATVSAGEVFVAQAAGAARIILPQQGVMVLQQSVDRRLVDAALLGSTAAWVVPDQSTPAWQLRALGDAQVCIATLQASAVAVCAELLMRLQMHMMQQVALWGFCRKHHALPQRLATILSMLQGHAERWDWQAWPDVLNVPPALLEAGLQALQVTGAVSLQTDGVEIKQPQALADLGCTCLQPLKRQALQH